MVDKKNYVKTVYAILLIASLTCLFVSSVFGQEVTTGEPFNIQSWEAGRSLIYQDVANDRIVNWTVSSGTWNGTGSITITDTQGTFTFTPTQACTVTVTTVNAFILVGSSYQTTYVWTFTPSVASTLTWVFSIPSTPTPTATVAPSPTYPPVDNPKQYYLFLNTTGQGTTSPASNIYWFYNEGTTISISATASSGWAFNYWLFGDGSTSYDLTTTLTMTESQTALAVFSQIPVIGEPTPTPTVAPTPIPTLPVFIRSIDTTSLWQYLNNRDFAGFIVACWTMNLGQSFFVIVALIVSIAVYIRYQNLVAIGIMWIVLGSVFIVWVPVVAPFIIFAFAVGIGSLVYKVFEPKN